MQYKKLILFTILILSIIITLTGCYDSKDIENVSIVLSVGCDVNDDKNQYSFAVAQIESKDNGSEVPVKIETVEADNIYDALYMLQKTQSKILSLTHIECAVFSDTSNKIFKDTIYDMTERLNVNSASNIAVCKGSAKEFLDKISKDHEKNFSAYLKDMFITQRLIPKLNVYDAYCSIKSQKAICMPYLKAGDEDNENYEYGICTANNKKDYKITELTDENAINFYAVFKGYTNTLVIKEGYKITDIKLKKTPSISVSDRGIKVDYVLLKPKDKANEDLIKNKTKEYFETLKTLDTDIMEIEEISKRNFINYNSWKKFNFKENYKNLSLDAEVSL